MYVIYRRHNHDVTLEFRIRRALANLGSGFLLMLLHLYVRCAKRGALSLATIDRAKVQCLGRELPAQVSVRPVLALLGSYHQALSLTLDDCRTAKLRTYVLLSP